MSHPRDLIRTGFPADISSLPPDIKKYHSIAMDIHEVNDILMHHDKVIISAFLQPLMPNWFHEGHLGRNKCKMLAISSMFWFGMSKDIDDFVSKCSMSNFYRTWQPREPIILHEVPERPWQKVGADIFILFGLDYLLVVNYFSKHPEVALLSGKKAVNVIVPFKLLFSRHNLTEVVIADNNLFNS